MEQILKLLVFLTLCCAVQGRCDGLSVKNNDNVQIDIDKVCVTKYEGEDCMRFYLSFSPEGLPKGFPKWDSAVSPVKRPSYLHVKIIDTVDVEKGQTYAFPGLQIEWGLPVSEIDRDVCYGYLLTLTRDDNLYTCQLFHFNKIKSETLHFRYIIPKVDELSEYITRIHSIPTARLPYRNNNTFYALDNVRTAVKFITGEPARWVPFMAMRTMPSVSIDVKITLPPAEFNITHFNMYLVKESPFPMFKKKAFSAPLRTSDNREVLIELLVRESGSYRIVVWVEDKFPFDKNLCQCWQRSNSVKRCIHTCGMATTDFFYVHVQGKTDYPIGPLQFFSIAENNKDTQSAIIGGLMVVVLWIAIFGVTAVAIRNKIKEKQNPTNTKDTS